jgi:hypothetical protein
MDTAPIRVWAQRILLLSAVVVTAVWIGKRLHIGNDEIAVLPLPDFTASGDAGTIESVRGQVTVRTPPQSAAASLSVDGGSRPFRVPSSFALAEGATLELATEGNWQIGIEGKAELTFEDARTNPDRTIRAAYWTIKSGIVRIRSADYDPADLELQIRTPLARILFRRAEAGLRISDGGRGEVWLVAGSGVVVWNDGRRKTLTVRGMEYI